MDATWAFCPDCGVDNRMPRERKAVPHHFHQFIARRGYCILCGEPIDEPYSFGYKWRVRLSVTAVLAGLLGVGFVVFLQISRSLPNTPFGRWVISWYSNPVTHRSGRRYHHYTYTSELGHDVTLYLGGASVLVLGLGIAMLCKVPWPEDDGPRWRRMLW